MKRTERINVYGSAVRLPQVVNGDTSPLGPEYDYARTQIREPSDIGETHGLRAYKALHPRLVQPKSRVASPAKGFPKEDGASRIKTIDVDRIEISLRNASAITSHHTRRGIESGRRA
ncbi:hypothetical protein C0992_006501 [Termitomyces sp. T32_za158]|nr:hypothetical protein C0992_006501 [Termitomyces sp. T32_za158]